MKYVLKEPVEAESQHDAALLLVRASNDAIERSLVEFDPALADAERKVAEAAMERRAVWIDGAHDGHGRPTEKWKAVVDACDSACDALLALRAVRAPVPARAVERGRGE